MRSCLMIVCLALLTACGEDRSAAKLAGSLHGAIPVFEPSTVEKIEDFVYEADDGVDEPVRYRARSWTLSTGRPLVEVLAFYERVAPPSEQDDGLEDEEELDPTLDWGDEDEVADEDQRAGAEREPVDLPSRVFHLPVEGTLTVELAVYLQPRQRRIWFSITETRPANDL